MEHIGIVACSAEGAALCYQAICRGRSTRVGQERPPSHHDRLDPARGMDARVRCRRLRHRRRDHARVGAAARRRRLRLADLPRQLGAPGVGARRSPNRRCRGSTSPSRSAPRRARSVPHASGCSARASRWSGRVYPDALGDAGHRGRRAPKRDRPTSTASSSTSWSTASSSRASRGDTSRSSGDWRAAAPTPWRWRAPRSRCSIGPGRLARCRRSTRRACWHRPRSPARLARHVLPDLAEVAGRHRGLAPVPDRAHGVDSPRAASRSRRRRC